MSVRDDLGWSRAEETLAATTYRERAASARAEGDEESARLFEHIAAEEEGHYREFQDRWQALMPPEYYTTPEDTRYPSQVENGHISSSNISFSHISPPVVTPTLFPETDTDWENLGFDIEARLTGIGSRYSIRDAVAIATGKKEGDANRAKRWLVSKAGELGIT